MSGDPTPIRPPSQFSGRSGSEPVERIRDNHYPEYGIVVIGRNEGERLMTCLRSLVGARAPIVYVDSGSTDGSQAFARSLDIEVEELDMAVPFTAARARNAGFERLLALNPSLRFVQFVDGDCEVLEGWLDAAERTLQEQRDVAAVCGRRVERYPEKSIYNRACDLEWDTPVGEASEFGGEVMIRVEALREVGGYNPSIIAAEDTELSIRLRKLGWRLLRIDMLMSKHDAAILHFEQWWKRMVRGGHGTAENRAIHGSSPFFHRKGWTRSTLFWGLAVPAGGLAMAGPTLGLSMVGATLGYGAQVVRLERAARRQGRSPEEARAWAINCAFGKIPETLGHFRYWRNRLTRRASTLIEYK